MRLPSRLSGCIERSDLFKLILQRDESHTSSPYGRLAIAVASRIVTYCVGMPLRWPGRSPWDRESNLVWPKQFRIEGGSPSNGAFWHRWRVGREARSWPRQSCER
jgi:hypothetical protein